MNALTVALQGQVLRVAQLVAGLVDLDVHLLKPLTCCGLLHADTLPNDDAVVAQLDLALVLH